MAFKKLTEAEKLARKQAKEAAAEAAAAASGAPAAERKKRSASTYGVQVAEFIADSIQALNDPSGRYVWSDIIGSHATVKAAKEAISAQSAEGKYRVIRIMETVVAKPRTGLELAAA